MSPSKVPTRASGLASAGVHDGLRARILSGDLAPGDPVPSERVLSEELGVNRHAVREALKRLQQAGLVQITQGGATRVLDWRSSAGLEVLLDLVEEGSEPTGDLIRSVLEMRASVGTDAARLCALRGDEETRAAVKELAHAAADAIAEGTPNAIDAFVGFWTRIVDGSGNVAYRLGLNSLNAALDAYPELGESLVPRDGDTLRQLGTAVGSGDSEAAAVAARALLEPDIDIAG
jgi:GntR family transcriptional repressor for pyruvate dehydrogenase complex